MCSTEIKTEVRYTEIKKSDKTLHLHYSEVKNSTEPDNDKAQDQNNLKMDVNPSYDINTLKIDDNAIYEATDAEKNYM